MKVLVWVVSALAAVAFVAIGLGKLVVPTDELTAMSQGVPVPLLRIAGLAELLGGLGLVLPAATRILPSLTPLAAAGLVVTMIGAIVTNIALGSVSGAVVPVALLLVAAAIGWARATRYAIAPRHLAAAH